MWICSLHVSNTQTVILPIHYSIFLIFFSFLSVQENNTIWDRLTSGQSALTLLLVSTDIHTSSEKHREKDCPWCYIPPVKRTDYDATSPD